MITSASVGSKKSRVSTESVRLYPLKVQEMDPGIIPRRKKKLRHLKRNAFNNFYKETPASFKPKSYNKVLDGFLLLNACKVEKPNEAIRVNLQAIGIADVVQPDLKEFINLSSLDLSDNAVRLEQLKYLESLTYLNLMCNKISSVPVLPTHCFRYLETLLLSYNSIHANSIIHLSTFPRLKVLDLSSNELCALPEDMSGFKALQELRVSSNAFSTDSVLFSASTFFKALSTLPALVKLDISRNKLRGIHHDALPANPFSRLKELDFSYNWADSQEDLLCAASFQSLQLLVITGNPFAQQNNYSQLEKTLNDELGATVLNENPFKKREKPPLPKPIAYINQEYSLALKNQLFEPSLELSNIQSEQPPKSIEPPEVLDPHFFLTETENQTKKKPEKAPANKLEEFRLLAQELLSDEKCYERPSDLQTAYRQLKHLMKHPLTYQPYQGGSTGLNRSRHSNKSQKWARTDALSKVNQDIQQINYQLNRVERQTFS